MISVLSGVIGTIETEASGLDENNYCADISEYRTGNKEEWTYPTKEGYVFAGWYSDSSCAKEYALSESDVSGGAYAKFVDEDVLSVKLQMNALANIADDTMNLRMLTSVDSLAYQSVGFRFKTGSVSSDYMSKTVYLSILADGKTYKPNVFSDSSNFIVGHSMNKIPAKHYGTEFTIIPIWVTQDGTTVEGVERTFTIREDYTVGENLTKQYNGATLDFWFQKVKVNANQWFCFDIEGLPVSDGTLAASIRFMVKNGTNGDDNFYNRTGNMFYYKAKGDKIRFYGQIYGDYANTDIGVRLFNGHGATNGDNITVSNVRITNAPDDVRYYNIDHSGGAYFEPTEFINVTGKNGQVLSFKVDLQHGNLLNHTGAGDPKTWVRVNGVTNAAWNSFRVEENEDGTQTVEVKLTADITSFRPTFSIQNLPEGVTENKMIISDIQVYDVVNWEKTGYNFNFEYSGIEIVKGATLSFDIDSDRPLTVYITYTGKASGDIILSYLETKKGTVTLTYQFPIDTTSFTIQTRDWASSENYTAKISNLKVEQAKPLAVHAESGLPYEVSTSGWATGHVQGIAIDDKREYMYYSFTTVLVKVNMSNGVVEGTVALPNELHLGDMDFYNGKLYGSISGGATYVDLQYIAVFDVDTITKVNTPYSTVMKAIYIEEAVTDISENKYGRTGIDGFTFGTMPGDTSGNMYMYVATGGSTVEPDRTDKNYQILYAYEADALDTYMEPLDMNNLHKNGPELYQKLFIYTGQHYSGPQSLTYDHDTGDIWMGMYAETVDGFPPYRLLAIDGEVAPVYQDLDLGDNPGVEYDESETDGYVLALKEVGVEDDATGIWGYTTVPHDVATGFVSLGNNYFYVSYNGTISDLQYSKAQLYYLDRDNYYFTRVQE